MESLISWRYKIKQNLKVKNLSLKHNSLFASYHLEKSTENNNAETKQDI